MNRINIKGVQINNWVITQGNGSSFQAKKNNIIIFFSAEGKKGGLYSKITNYYNATNNRSFKALRFTKKYISTIRDISDILLENDYLWDYKKNKPALLDKMQVCKMIDLDRKNKGLKGLYVNYLKYHNNTLEKLKTIKNELLKLDTLEASWVTNDIDYLINSKSIKIL